MPTGGSSHSTGRLEVPDVVVERHPELAVRVEADVQLATVSRRDRLPLGGSVRPRAAPLAVTLAPRVAQAQQSHSPAHFSVIRHRINLHSASIAGSSTFRDKPSTVYSHRGPR